MSCPESSSPFEKDAVVPDPVPAPVSAAYRPVGLLLSSQTSPGPYPIGRLFSFQGAESFGIV